MTVKETQTEQIVVWDSAVRMVHWALVGLLGFCWYSARIGQMDWHRWSGYGVLGLVLFRLIWGGVGSSTARFATFVKGPATVARYIGALPQRGTAADIGHNPLGAVSVLTLLLILVVQVVTGLFAVDVDGIESGPLSDRVSFDQGRWLASVHHGSFTVLQVMVALHIAAIAFYFTYKRDNLIRPMITGKRYATGPGMKRASIGRLAASIAIAALLTWFVARGLHF